MTQAQTCSRSRSHPVGYPGTEPSPMFAARLPVLSVVDSSFRICFVADIMVCLRCSVING